MSIHEHFTENEVDVAALARYLDGLGAERAALFDAADGVRPLGLADMVPPDAAPLVEVIHYGGTQDVVRGVARGVSVGRATRGGKPMDNWFVLCRAPDGPGIG
jgi:hypothetical protein